LLSPLGALYGTGTKYRLANGPRAEIGVPVICVGNINAGGTGKTPTVVALIERLQSQRMTPHVVSRGYGGSEQGPLKVIEGKHSAAKVGDEPLLLSAFADVWIAKNRLKGAKAAAVDGADVIILDDGFQNPALAYDLSLVVIDATRGFGNGHVMPAGPLREPVEQGLKRADALLSIGPDPAQSGFKEMTGIAFPVPHLKGQLEPLRTGMEWQGTRVLAFAGIGNPDKFFATVRGLGADLIKGEPLEDHQPLTKALMTRLMAEAKTLNAQLVTTEKDAVRLPPEFRREVLTVPVRLVIEDWSALDQLISKRITAQRR
jgi:tetraacyldisaccharide 4'-kinase